MRHVPVLIEKPSSVEQKNNLPTIAGQQLRLVFDDDVGSGDGEGTFI